VRRSAGGLAIEIDSQSRQRYKNHRSYRQGPGLTLFQGPFAVTDPTPEDRAEQQPEDHGRRVVDSADLLQGEKAVLIRHDDQMYRLIVTRNGKLILQK
jgi:hemin uptake protein HemP